MSRVNQHKIAEMLQLSQTTVSRSLANHPAINAETKALVLDTAAKLGYSQRIKRTNTSESTTQPSIWGVLIAMPKQFSGPSETFQQVLRGIADKSSLHESVLDVVYYDPAEKNSQKILRRVRSTGWKGVILIYPLDPVMAHEIANQVPCVSIIENYRHDLIDSVDVDQSEAIYTLIKQLHDQGHRKIGFMSWVYGVDTPWVMRRFGSYVEALFRLKLEFNQSTAINVHAGQELTPEECAQRVAEQVRNGDITAVVCAADHQAYALIEDLATEDIRVPEDLSVTGFDGVNPPHRQKQVATVLVPYEELGRSATHQLVRRIEQPTAPRRHILVDGDIQTGETISRATG
ncbi:LacI family transcriptional regulator [Puniceicoccales bacterium CK1056]|uniref:LacI family transcriptional regulator n=1 Tax=Oceanipulchritudo coccoides TaxID=2706888 RepID=A0A6B2M4N5_9BACT|nr:LacI family DNA-binding transcriptional regulator [Oceanipulchritudo coccoides]NDV63242.1 LacI family transcriptional regulator [Oceanipulchritudo coccoides]